MINCTSGVRFVTACLLLSALQAQASAAPDCDNPAAHAVSVQGSVESRQTDTKKWTAVERNQSFCPGDHIRVGKESRASIVFSNETIVRLDEFTALTITRMEKDEVSLLDLLKGIAHFISRVPRSMKVQTPFVNAAIEGTEFVVAVSDNNATVTVFEGTVLTRNAEGEVRITDNEASRAARGSAPQKILLARPRDAVQWALYFPPLLTAKQHTDAAQQASGLLFVGRVTEAERIIAQALPQASPAQRSKLLALQSIIAVTENRTPDALALAQQAIAADHSAAAFMALSYAQQADLKLDEALQSAQQATQIAADNALAWARQAELQLATGHLQAALHSATVANQQDDALSRTRSILGFAYLIRGSHTQAEKTFNAAINLDQSDPLPRLGLGLTLIRLGQLQQGRRDIEIAASLDPNNAIIRSYLGKAYFEEDRSPLDAEQFAMAKALDPSDPTAYFYDALRLQTENDPVGALRELQKSIELNDNRAVYRSSLQLDQDEAARNASAGRIYQDLGQEQQAIELATRSLSKDPANYSAHELLANLYVARQRHEIARTSEILQSNILNPLTLNPQKPQLTQNSLTFLNSLGTNSSSINEYNHLFRRNQLNLNTNVLVAGQNTEGSEFIASGVSGNLAFSLGKYFYTTDGYATNNGHDLILGNYFVQAQFLPSLSVFFQREEKNEIRGDNYRFYPTNISSSIHTDDHESGNRTGIRYSIAPSHTLLATYLNHSRKYVHTQNFGIAGNLFNKSDDDDDVTELRYIFDGNVLDLNLGHAEVNNDKVIQSLFNTTPLSATGYNNVNESRSYLYSSFSLAEPLLLTLGYAHETYKSNNLDVSENNPKVGVSWSPAKSTTLRLAYLKTLTKSDVGFTTLEPTTVAGFNQFYDDQVGSLATQKSFAIDYRISPSLVIGLEATKRELDVPIVNSGTVTYHDFRDDTGVAYAYWIVNDAVVVNISALYENLVRGSFTGNLLFENVKTRKYPLAVNVFHNDTTSSRFLATYIQQEGIFVDQASKNGIPGKDSFWHLDYALNYRLQGRRGLFSLGVKNLLDEQFFYEETDRNMPTVAPDRTVFMNINLSF